MKKIMPDCIKGVLFDLDGTLIDSAPDLFYCINQVLTINKREPVEFLKLRQLISGGTDQIIKGCFGDGLDTEKIVVLREQFWQFYAASLTNRTRIFPGINDLIMRLSKTKTPWGIVTNKVGRFAKPIIKHFGWENKASSLVYGDTLNVSKPDPKPLLTASQDLGVMPTNCAYIGDTQLDIKAAKAAGMISIVVEYGYSNIEFENLAKLSDFSVFKAEELNAFIEKRN